MHRIFWFFFSTFVNLDSNDSYSICETENAEVYNIFIYIKHTEVYNIFISLKHTVAFNKTQLHGNKTLN